MKYLNVKFALLQGAYWAAFCVLFSFMVPLYREWGFSDSLIGVMMSCAALANLIAPILWGMYSDSSGRIKSLFIGAMGVSALLIGFLPFGSQSPWIAVIVVMLLSATVSSVSSLIDTWSLKFANQGEDVNYSLTRAFGSLAFGLCAISFGTMLDGWGAWLRYPVFAGFVCIIVWIAGSIPSPRVKRVDSKVPVNLNAFLQVIRIRPFAILLVAVLSLSIGTGANNSFYPLLLQEMGGDNTELGIALLLTASGQFLGILLFSRGVIRWPNVSKWLIISMFLAIVNWTLIALSPNLQTMMYLRLMECVTFGFFFPASIMYINQSISSHALATANTIYAAMSIGLGTIIGNLLGGVLSQWYGIRWMIAIENGIMLLGWICFVFLYLKFKRTENEMI